MTSLIVPARPAREQSRLHRRRGRRHRRQRCSPCASTRRRSTRRRCARRSPPPSTGQAITRRRCRTGRNASATTTCWRPPIPPRRPTSPNATSTSTRWNELLVAAGVEDLSFTLTFEPPSQDYAVVLQEQLNQAGITVELDQRTSDEFYARRSGEPTRRGCSRRPTSSAWAGRAVPTQFIIPMVKSDGVWNGSKYANPDLDAAADAYDAATDEAENARSRPGSSPRRCTRTRRSSSRRGRPRSGRTVPRQWTGISGPSVVVRRLQQRHAGLTRLMGPLVLRRVGALAITLPLTSVVVFVLTSIVPGDVARRILGREAPQDAVDAKRAELGLDRPLVEQYRDWLSGFLRGDWGTSYTKGEPVRELVLDALGRSLVLGRPRVRPPRAAGADARRDRRSARRHADRPGDQRRRPVRHGDAGVRQRRRAADRVQRAARLAAAVGPRRSTACTG